MRGEGLIRKPSPYVGPTTKSWHKSENHNFNVDSLDVQNAFDVLGKAIGSKRGNEGSVELLKECSNIPPMSEALATSEKSEEGSPELPEKSGDEGQTA